MRVRLAYQVASRRATHAYAYTRGKQSRTSPSPPDRSTIFVSFIFHCGQLFRAPAVPIGCPISSDFGPCFPRSPSILCSLPEIRTYLSRAEKLREVSKIGPWIGVIGTYVNIRGRYDCFRRLFTLNLNKSTLAANGLPRKFDARDRERDASLIAGRRGLAKLIETSNRGGRSEPTRVRKHIA